MKLFYWNIIALFFIFTAQGQTSVQQPAASPLATSERWKLDEYIWSHTHPQRGKNEKPVLDFDAIDNGVGLSPDVLSISADGNYFVYGVQNTNKYRLDTVIVQATGGQWRAVLSSDAKTGFFSADNRQYIFRDKSGLCFLQNGSDQRRYEKGVKGYKKGNNGEWLAYRVTNQDSTLVFINLLSGEEKRINKVGAYFFDAKGEWLVYCLLDRKVVLRNLVTEKEVVFAELQDYHFDASQKHFVGSVGNSAGELILYDIQSSKERRFSNAKFYKINTSGEYMLLHTATKLEYVSLVEGNSATILSDINAGTDLKNAEFDETGRQVVFVTGSGANKAIWHWKLGMDKAAQQVNSQTPGIGKNGVIQDGVDFTADGRYIRFMIKPVIEAPGKPAPGAIQLDVWSYQDTILQSAQPFQKKAIDRTAFLHLETGKLLVPEREFEQLSRIGGDYALIQKSGKDIYGDRFWERGYYEDSIWIVSLKTGSRSLVPVQNADNIDWFSPDGRYLIYFDTRKGCHFYRYELASNKTIKLSAGVPDSILGYRWRYLRTPEKPGKSYGIAFWVEENKRFLVYDNNGDIWQLDVSGNRQAVCITNGYGKWRDLTFTILRFSSKDTLLLGAFDRKTKAQGFFKKVLSRKGAPELLSMDPCYLEGLNRARYTMTLAKAQTANIWILKRQTATRAPNYFISRDLKTFTQLTNFEPHKNYNWLTTELHSFKQLDGTMSQGVLYKPENFDPAKKYPLIISFYGDLSDRLHTYPAAEYLRRPSIFSEPAWMVSHGYLVFIPDIYFIKDQWGPSTVNTIDGAARYLRQLAYVDGAHLGAAGHSNSGRFGYYLLTHSKSFAAMSVGSGFTGGDVLSGALSLSLTRQGESCLEVAEVEAFGTALGNIWQNKARWIDHIAPLQVDRASSPFLLFHNKKDGDDVRLAIELFLAFRRLEKKCWWLQYDNGGHNVTGDDARDWTIRYTQFFDHYLKEAPAPRWMTRGIPAAKKGIETGYELDPGGTCAMQGKNTCKVCLKWNELYRKDPAFFNKSIGSMPIKSQPAFK